MGVKVSPYFVIFQLFARFSTVERDITNLKMDYQTMDTTLRYGEK